MRNQTRSFNLAYLVIYHNLQHEIPFRQPLNESLWEKILGKEVEGLGISVLWSLLQRNFKKNCCNLKTAGSQGLGSCLFFLNDNPLLSVHALLHFC